MAQPAPDPPILQIRPLPAVPLFAAVILLIWLIMACALGGSWREQIIFQAILGAVMCLILAILTMRSLARTITLYEHEIVVGTLGRQRSILLSEIAEIDLRIEYRGHVRIYILVLWGGDEHEPVAQIDCAYVVEAEIVRLVEQIEARDPAIGVSRQLRAWMVG